MAALPIEQALQTAIAHHQAGRLAEAEALYRQILAQQPQHADALHLLGVIALQVGRNDVAVDLIKKAVNVVPNHAEAHCNLGSALKHSGQLGEAIAAYRQAIDLKPNYTEAYSNLGNALRANGHIDQAIVAFHQAIALNPTLPEAHYNLGIALKDNGQFDEAIAACRQAIALRAKYPEAHSNLGIALKEKGQLDEAIAAYHQAITDKPNYAEAHNNLGNALKNKGQLDEAIAAYHRAIAIKPNYAEAHSNLGNALKDNGQFDEAIAACRQAIALKPNLPEAHYNLANALKDREQFDESIAAYQQAIAIKPNYPEAYSNLGAALKDKGQLDKAIVACRQAIVLKPNLLEAHYNLGNALKNKGQLEEAIASIRQAIIIKPNYAEAHCALALTLLLQAEFVQGWEEYEWRWKLKGFSSLLGKCMQAIWEGNHLRGHTILLHAEQGFGDTLQLIRYLPLVQERCAKIIVECQPELQRLLQAMLVDHTVVARGQPLPSFDIHCPLLSLPRLFTTDLTNIPSNVPYLHANATNARVWRDRLADHSSSAKVGIVWAGNPANTNDRNRTLKLLTLAPLAGVSNVRFFSLQKGMAGSEAKTLPIGMQLTDFADELKDFADTAALIANLDLVITVDTAVAHLAGAMGRPVWTLLPFAPDWRWLLDREDSPWYPTMRLFRQPALGDWDSVIRRLAGELAALQN